MVFFQTDKGKTSLSATSTQELNDLVKSELADAPYRGNIITNEDGRITVEIKIFGTIIVEKEVF